MIELKRFRQSRLGLTLDIRFGRIIQIGVARIIGGKHHGNGQAKGAFNRLPLSQRPQDVLSFHAD